MSKRNDRATQRARLAELVSQHGLVGYAATQMGISLSYAGKLWAEIRAELGAQAA